MSWFKRFNERLNAQVGAASAAPTSSRHWKLTGGSSDYYKVEVQSPTTGPTPYMAECNDIVEALHMTFAEGNVFKAVWRSAAARLGTGKPGTTATYDAEKVVFFGLRMLDMAKQAEQNSANG